MTLPLGEGYKTVEARFQDAVGNISATVSTTVVFDMTPPSGWFFVADDAVAVSSTSTVVEAYASDMNGPVLMRIRNGGSPWPSSWSVIPSGDQPWTLPSGDGTKWVDIEFKDAAGNISVLRQSVILDTTPPSGGLSIDGGAAATNATSATLGLTVTDANAPIDMRLRDSGGEWGTWYPFRDSSSWTLPAGDGTKTVEVQYRDIAGNLSSAIPADILLDTITPVTTDDAPLGSYRSVRLSLMPGDAAPSSGVVHTYYRIDGGAWKSGTVIALRKPVRHKIGGYGPGTHTIDYYSVDAAGNTETWHSCTVTLH